MNCCHEATEAQFDEAYVERELKRYREKGPNRTARRLLEAIRAEGLAPFSLLDVGAGIGAIHHELLEELAERAIHVEVSSAYLTAARKESARRGHSGKVQFHHGDFTDLAEELPVSDVVTLDRVICCYPGFRRLVESSARKASSLYAASYPRDRWWVRWGNALENMLRRVQRNPFRTYVHPPAAIALLLRRAGFEKCFRKCTPVWEIVAYRRVGPKRQARD